MAMGFGVGKKTGNSGDQECVLGIRPPQILDPSQTPACAYQSVQGFKAGLEEHPGDELLGGGIPSTPGPEPLCRDAD